MLNVLRNSSYLSVSNEEKKQRKLERKRRKQVSHHAKGLEADADSWLGTAEDLDKFTRRTVRVTREHNEECRKLLGLMGIPVVEVCWLFSPPSIILTRVQAPSEAEAQCAELARGGKVCATDLTIPLAQ